jgi:hypothetical protein
VIGLCFHRADWLGGYSSWPRRLVRLGHISFIGTGLLNIAFGLSVDAFDLSSRLHLAPTAFIVGAVAMPIVCFASAWRPRFRHLFFIPVASLVVATAEMAYRSVL